MNHTQLYNYSVVSEILHFFLKFLVELLLQVVLYQKAIIVVSYNIPGDHPLVAICSIGIIADKRELVRNRLDFCVVDGFMRRPKWACRNGEGAQHLR